MVKDLEKKMNNAREFISLARSISKEIKTRPESPFKLTEKGQTVLLGICTYCNVSIGKLMSAWKDACASVPFESYIQENASGMMLLERRTRGCVHFLFNERGIRNFTRLSFEELTQMYEKDAIIDSIDHKPIIVVILQHDYGQQNPVVSGALEYVQPQIDAIRNNYIGTTPPEIICIEGNSFESVITRIGKIYSRMPRNVGLPHVLILGHGDRKQMQVTNIGMSKHRRMIRAEHLKNIKLKKQEGDTGAIAIVTGCETGHGRNPIAKYLVDLGYTVHAPPSESSGTVALYDRNPHPKTLSPLFVLYKDSKGNTQRMRIFKNKT